MERIVLGYDGSPAAKAALVWVADRAADRKVQVEIVHVADIFETYRAETRDRLEEAQRLLSGLAPGTTVVSRMYEGSPTDGLVEAARDRDLLVLGIHPRARTRSVLTGAVPLRVSARSSVPTCLVPTGWQRRSGPVTVGVDDDDSSRAAVDFAAAEARTTGHPLRVVHAWLTSIGESGERTAALKTSTQTIAQQHQAVLQLATSAVRERFPDLAVEEDLVRNNAVSALSSLADRSSLLVIGTHHRGLIAGTVLGSVALDLIGLIRDPLCVVPAPATV